MTIPLPLRSVTRKILVVEDESGASSELASRLAALGYEVVAVAAPTGEAIALARSAPEQLLMAGTASSLAAVARAAFPSELEERFFDVSIDMLCCLDFNGHFKRLNLAWERALGFTREELMSRPFIEFVHPDDRERTLRQNRDVRAGGQARSFENRYVCKDGSYRWLLWNATADVPHHVIYSVARDVTRSKVAELEREELVKQLTTALAEVKTLRELLPMCAYCRRIRDEGNDWYSVEEYISTHTRTRFTHGICPRCYEHEVRTQLDALKGK